MRFVPGKDKDAFLVYASTLDVLEELPEKRQGEVALMLLDFGFRDDMTVPFECSDNDWIMLHQVFEGIVRGKKRYQIGLRLKNIIRKLELIPIDDKDKASMTVRIEKLKQLGELAQESPDEVGEANILNILGPKIYSMVSQPSLLAPSLLAEFKKCIAKAPRGQREQLEKGLDDLVEFCKQRYSLSPDGTKQPNSTSTQATKDVSTSVALTNTTQSPPRRPRGRYEIINGVAWTNTTQSPPKRPIGRYEACARQSETISRPEQKHEVRKASQPDKEPFTPNDFPEEVLAKAAPPSLFDYDGFGDYEISPLNLSKGGKN